MESSASGELGGLAPILLMVFLAGFGLALMWLFGEPQRSRGRSADPKRPAAPSEQTPAYFADPADSRAGRKRPASGGGPRLPVRGVLERWGCFSRLALRVILQHLSMALAVASFGVLAGTALAFLWRWMFGN